MKLEDILRPNECLQSQCGDINKIFIRLFAMERRIKCDSKGERISDRNEQIDNPIYNRSCNTPFLNIRRDVNWTNTLLRMLDTFYLIHG